MYIYPNSPYEQLKIKLDKHLLFKRASVLQGFQKVMTFHFDEKLKEITVIKILSLNEKACDKCFSAFYLTKYINISLINRPLRYLLSYSNINWIPHKQSRKVKSYPLSIILKKASTFLLPYFIITDHFIFGSLHFLTCVLLLTCWYMHPKSILASVVWHLMMAKVFIISP